MVTVCPLWFLDLATMRKPDATKERSLDLEDVEGVGVGEGEGGRLIDPLRKGFEKGLTEGFTSPS